MFIQPYTIDEIDFAYCNRVYLRFRTHRRKPVAALSLLTNQVMGDLLAAYGIQLLEFGTTDIDLRILVSLAATESVSVATSKIKGRLSKWISDQVAIESHNEKQKWLGRGYFASTSGHARTAEVTGYLDRQSNHHGYDKRPRPPIYVQNFNLDETILRTDHAISRLRYHFVLATEWRRGVFHDVSAPVITTRWRKIQTDLKAVIEKVSFLPDHVHIAVSVHPLVSPAFLVVALMNEAQAAMWEHFESDVVHARVGRLWQKSAYIGLFGDLRTAAMAAYVKKWDTDVE